MMHSTRVWCVSPIESAEELARKLTETTWCCCTGFQLGDYVWLNDASGPDGAQEYGVVHRQKPDGPFRQIESVTISWCSPERVLELIERTLRGEFDHSDFAHEVSPVLQTAEEHGRCPHCA